MRVQEILLKNINLLENKEDAQEIPTDVIKEPKYLEIYVKKYNFKDALSNYITSSEKMNDLNINGPIVIYWLN